MEHPVTCLHEHEWGQIQEYIKNQNERWAKIEEKIYKHIDEGERAGGVRERLVVLEREVKNIQDDFWKVGVSGGFIGALLGNIAPDVVSVFVKWIVGG